MSIEHYRLEVWTRSPLVLGTFDQATGNINDLEHYVSGRRLRGALAALLAEYPTDRGEIEALLGSFSRPGLRLPTCYPVPHLVLEADANGLASVDLLPGPTPASVRVCKRERQHLASDLVLAQGLFASIGSSRHAFLPRCQGDESEPCGEPVKGYEGAMAPDRVQVPSQGAGPQQGPARYLRCEAHPHAQTHVGINRYLHAAEDSFLYTVQAFDQGLLFVGHLQVETALEPLATVWLPKIRRLGGRSSRGFGAVEIKLTQIPPPGQLGALAARLERFNARRLEVWNELGTAYPVATPPKAGLEDTWLTLDLCSDALLSAADGLPTARLRAETLVRALERTLDRAGAQETLPDIEVLEQWTRPRLSGGWHTGWQVPRPVRTLAGAGSVYLIRVARPLHAWSPALLGAFADLEHHGIGAELEDGLGHLRWCHPVHSDDAAFKLV